MGRDWFEPAASIEPVTDRHRAVHGSRAAEAAACSCALPVHTQRPKGQGRWTAVGVKGALFVVG